MQVYFAFTKDLRIKLLMDFQTTCEANDTFDMFKPLTGWVGPQQRLTRRTEPCAALNRSSFFSLSRTFWNWSCGTANNIYIEFYCTVFTRNSNSASLIRLADRLWVHYRTHSGLPLQLKMCSTLAFSYHWVFADAAALSYLWMRRCVVPLQHRATMWLWRGSLSASHRCRGSH